MSRQRMSETISRARRSALILSSSFTIEFHRFVTDASEPAGRGCTAGRPGVQLVTSRAGRGHQAPGRELG
jgi:hypothetical protein